MGPGLPGPILVSAYRRQPSFAVSAAAVWSQTVSTASKRLCRSRAPPLRPPVGALRVMKDFTCEELRFREGQLLSPDSPIAQAIHREYPHYLQPAQNRD
jgi:hypothetical protein